MQKPQGEAVATADAVVVKEREYFSSRLAFICAAVGSAVGFGNVWRFPSLAADYGGGAFFIPYVLALFIIGIPVIFLEISLGQLWQTGDFGVFYSFHRRLGGVGMSSIACGFILVTYYSMLLAWVTNAFFDSFTSSAPWTDPGITGSEAQGYFFNQIIGMETANEDLTATRIIPANVGYSALGWFVVWLCTAWGVKVTGIITYFTMGFPIVLLFVFLIRGCLLEGSELGIKQYIGIWDMSVLRTKPDVWSTAVSQIFFSLSVTFGIMTAYGSHMPRHEPAFINSCTISITNCMFSFLAGFAVFAALGHEAFLEGIPVTDLGYVSFGLVFGTWPVVLGKLPGGIHWVRLFFFMLFLLGIDSAFSLLEGVMTVARDTTIFKDTPKWKVSGVGCITGFLCSLMYATDAGLFWLDVIDFYLNFFMLLVGFFETFSLGWVYGIDVQFEKFGTKAVVSYCVANFGAVILASIIWFGVKNQNSIWGGFIALFGFYFVGLGVTHYLLPDPTMARWKDLAFGNIFEFKARAEKVIGFVPSVFCVLVKQIVPHVLLILFANLAAAQTADGQSKLGHYEGYPFTPFQIMGIMTVVFAASLFVVGVFVPQIYKPFAMPEDFVQPGLLPETTAEKEVAPDSDADADAEKEDAPEEQAMELEA